MQKPWEWHLDYNHLPDEKHRVIKQLFIAKNRVLNPRSWTYSIFLSLRFLCLPKFSDWEFIFKNKSSLNIKNKVKNKEKFWKKIKINDESRSDSQPAFTLVSQMMGATLFITFQNDSKNIGPLDLKGFWAHETFLHSCSCNTPAPLNRACYLLTHLYKVHIGWLLCASPQTKCWAESRTR